ncbi:MAG: ribosome small subunit-dependent GTPase A [Chlamydiales bacterium]|nr:ribosome small subunit-dependent GTPase A [Chlamydiales bacterium]
MAKEGKRWIRCDVEDQYLGERRKESRQERKQVIARDRSKYKKTDSDKRQESFDAEALAAEGLKRGRAISIVPQGIVVHENGNEWMCELRGVLKKEKTQQKNLVAVGDYVWFVEKSQGEGAISAVEPRKTILSRADNLSRRKEQIIATNIDQVLITVSVIDPPLKPPLIDRYIIAARKGGMDPVVVINKVDKLDDSDNPLVLAERELYEECLQAYAQAEIPVICVSATNFEGMDKLRAQMKDRSSVFSGQSGVGKTSLINVVTGLDMRVAETVARTRKGSHTTTSASLIPLELGGWCVDTPGIKSFGVWDLDIDEIQQYFVEIYKVGRECAFTDCTHSHETDCAVKRAVEAGEISFMRFMSYQALVQSVEEGHTRR